MASAQLSIMTSGSLVADLLVGKTAEKRSDSSVVSFDSFLASAVEDVEATSDRAIGESIYEEPFSADAMDEGDRTRLDERSEATKPQERKQEDEGEAFSTDFSRSSAEPGLSGGAEVKAASSKSSDERKGDGGSPAKAEGVDKEEDVKTLERRLRDYIAAGDKAKAREILESLKALIKSGKVDNPKDLILRLSALLSNSGYLNGDAQSKALSEKLEGELSASLRGASAEAKPKLLSSESTGEVLKEKAVSASESDLKGSKSSPNLLVKSASSDLKGLRGSTVLHSSASDKASEGSLKDRAAARPVKAGLEASTYRTLEPSVSQEYDGDLDVVVKKASGRLIGLKHEGSYDSTSKLGTGDKFLPVSEKSAGGPATKDPAPVAQRAVKEAASSVSEGAKEKAALASKDVTSADKKVSPGSGNTASSKPSGEQAKGAAQFSQLASQEISNGQRTFQTQSSSALSQGREVNHSQVFRQIVQKAQIMVSSGLAEMKLELKPENLGKLHLKLEMQGGMLTAKFMAESQQVKELIESNLSQLRQSLADQGLNFGKIEVSVGSSGGEGGFARNEDAPYASFEAARGFAVETPREEVPYDLAMAARVLSMDGATVNYLA